MTSFAALVCFYSLHEFFLTRILWRPAVAGARGHALMQGTLLFVTLCIGSSAILSPLLAACLAVIALVYMAFQHVSAGRTAGATARRSLEWFFAQQITIGCLLYAALQYAGPPPAHDWYTAFERTLLAGMGTYAGNLREKFASILCITAAYLFVIDGGTRIVKGVLGKFPQLYRKVLQTLNENAAGGPQTENEENVGEWIGILERIITLTLVLTGNFGAIAFVLTAKSIARFKALENKDFAEYYLLGTSASIIAALAAGIAARIVLGF